MVCEVVLIVMTGAVVGAGEVDINVVGPTVAVFVLTMLEQDEFCNYINNNAITDHNNYSFPTC